MKNSKNPINQNDPIDLIDHLKIMDAKKTKEQVWAELEQMLEAKQPEKAKVFSLFASKWAVAASIILLIGVLFLRFYTKSVVSLSGEQQVAILPDGSMVKLNAQSSLSYHPYWWNVSREVALEGEAFFKVKKGKKFTVVSDKGETSVLGTSFNIYARELDYEVTCLTGKVKVVSTKNKEQVIIIPNQEAVINSSGKIRANSNINAKFAVDWTEGKFIFTQIPLHKVFSEISRRYGIEIKNVNNLNQLYTGSFDEQNQIEAVLDLVCKPFDIEYKKLPSGEFAIQEVL